MFSKTCVKWPLSKRPKSVLKTNYCLMQVKNIAECSKGSILQYFQPALFSYHLSLRSLFCLVLSGSFTQVLPIKCLQNVANKVCITFTAFRKKKYFTACVSFLSGIQCSIARSFHGCYNHATSRLAKR